MIAFIAGRLLQALPVLATVGLIAFSIFTFVGDPVQAMLGIEASDADRIAMAHQIGLDRSFLTQYADFMWRSGHGDFGLSYRLARPVAGLIAERLPATLELALSAAFLALMLGIPLGVYTGISRGSLISRAFMLFSLAGVSLPTFLIGILLILLFSVQLGLLPSYGRGDVVQITPWWSTGFLTMSGLKALVLPAITLGLFPLTLLLRLIRAEMLEVLRSDHIKFSRARGLTEISIRFRHAFGNTLVPVVTIVGLQLGGLIAFSLVTESVFQWPGMGLLFIQSVGAADIPVMSAYLLMIAVLFVAINLLVDLLYYAIDPRLRGGR